MTKTLTLTQTDAMDMQSVLFNQLVEARREVQDGRGNLERAVRLEVLCLRFTHLCVEIANPQKVEA